MEIKPQKWGTTNEKRPDAKTFSMDSAGSHGAIGSRNHHQLVRRRINNEHIPIPTTRTQTETAQLAVVPRESWREVLQREKQDNGGKDAGGR